MKQMDKKMSLGIKSKMIAGMVAISMIAGAAYAQGRDPAYQAARTNGQIGEKTDGYLGVIGTQTDSIRALTKKINILRKQVYTKTAVSQGISVEKAAFLGGCKNIVRTVTGEKYQAPNGSWQNRGSGQPTLDSACP